MKFSNELLLGMAPTVIFRRLQALVLIRAYFEPIRQEDLLGKKGNSK